jgi:hypothetical protein
MKNLKVWQKLALMAAVFMVPFAVVSYKMMSSINALGTEFARQEIRGLEYYTPLLALLKDLQKSRRNPWARQPMKVPAFLSPREQIRTPSPIGLVYAPLNACS